MLTADRLAEIRDAMVGSPASYMVGELLAEVDRLGGENGRLTRQLEECWSLLGLATIPMEIGPGAGRLLRRHGRPT